MSLSKALAAIMFTMISQEVPEFRANPSGERAREYRADIELMVEIDARIAAAGHLVNPDVDRVLLAAVRYYESRFQSQPADGDCAWVHPKLSRQQRIRHADQRGLVPPWMVEPKRVCSAIGPMQIARGNRVIAPAFSEVREMFQTVKSWQSLVSEGENPWRVGRIDRLSIAELRQPEINVRLGYSLLWHWKVESNAGLGEESRATPPGVWLTAWGWGKLPPPNARTVRYVDREGRRRCALATRIMHQLAEQAETSGFSFTRPADWYCGHESYALSAPEI